MLYAKTLVRKDITSASAAGAPDEDAESDTEANEDFASKTQVMTLMTADTDRVCEFAWHILTLIGTPFHYYPLHSRLTQSQTPPSKLSSGW